jgi:carbohydrate-selective porin OprB
VGSHDSAGAAATWVKFSRDWDDYEPSGELTLELYYKLAFNQHFALVPDFQYIHNPGGLREDRDCPVVTSRLVISY